MTPVLRSARLGWFALVLGLFALAAPAQADKVPPPAHRGAPVVRAIHRTRTIIARAVTAVKKNGQGKDELRKGVVYNRAARATLRKGKPKVAMHLTLKARGFARAAIKANKETLAAAEDKDEPAEVKEAEAAPEAEAQAAVAEAEKEVPPVEQIAEKAETVDGEGAEAPPQ